MNILQIHFDSGAYQVVFQKIVEIKKFSEDSFELNIIDNNGDTAFYYVCPFHKWTDNMSDFLMLNGKTYSKKDLYTFCMNWITETVLNTLETVNDICETFITMMETENAIDSLEEL